MAGQTFSSGGVIYEDLGNGQVKVVGYEGSPTASATVAPNPARLAAKQAEEARQAAKDATDAQDKAADNARADASLGLQQANAALNQQLAQLKIDEAKIKAGESKGRATKLRSLVSQINRVQELYEAGPGTTKGPLGVVDYLPTDANAAFDVAGASLSQQGLAAFRSPGSGTVSDRDAIMFDKANLPTASTRDVAIEEILKGLRTRVNEEFATLGEPMPDWVGVDGQRAESETDKAAAFVDPGNPDLPPANEGGNAPETPWAARLGTDGPQQTAASGDYRTERDDRLSAQVDALINAGAGEATINATLKAKGFAPLPLGSLKAAREWMKQNPGKSYYGANAQREVPLNIGQRIAGSPAGAFTAQMTNAATAGTVGALAGDRGRGALDAMATMNPNASLAGSITGGITGAMGAELGVGARLAGTGLHRFAPRIADSLFGAATGFNNAADGEGLQGALTGAVVAPLAGAAGERAMRAVGSGVRGVVNPAVQRLREAGIPLTFGQAVGQSGRLGNFINKTEQAMSSIPGVGSMVGARFDDGTRGLNDAAFAIGAQTTGGQVQDVGSAGLAQLRQFVGQTYDNALHPGVRLDVTDPAVAQDIINAQMVAGSIPQVGDNAVNAIDYRVTGGAGVDGTMDGRDFQEAYRGLGRDGRAAARSDTYAHEVQGAMGQAQDALATGLEAQNPGAYQGFVNANTANRRAMVLADAINAAKNQGDEMFTPAQLNAADANSATRLTGRINSASGNRPFHQLAQDAQQVMGNRLPNSGTADRAMTGAALGTLGLGAGAGAGLDYFGPTEGSGTAGGLALAALLMGGGTRAGQQALTGAVLNRPAIARAVGEAIQRNAQIGGGFGAGILTPLTVGSQ